MIRLRMAVLGCLWAAAARANPADVIGFGARAAAIGNAATAVADDASANYYNPAGIVRGRDLRIDIGYQAALPTLELNGRNSQVDGIHGLVVGIAAPGHFGPLRIAFGAALYLPDDRITRVRAIPFLQPRWVYYDNRPQRFLLAANLALQIIPGLYIGGGLTFMSRTQGDVELRGQIAISDTDEQSALVKAISVDLVAVRYPQAGIVWQPNPWLTLAASYRHSFVLRLEQKFALLGDVGNPGAAPLIQNGSLISKSISSDLFQPWQLTFALAARLTRRLFVSYDLTFARWSEFETPAALLDLTLDVGPTFQPLVHLPSKPTYRAPGFHDIVIPRLGFEYRALDRPAVACDLRAGYSYEPSPAPEQFDDGNYADTDKHRVSLGLGVEVLRRNTVLLRPLSLDLYGAFTYLPERINRKANPVDATGDFVASGRLFEIGATTRWRF